MEKKKKIGLALGSGGPRGLSHIGVIKVLEENGIKPDIIAGSSIGALIGGAYIVLNSIEEVEKISLSTDMKTVLGILFDPTIKLGLIKGEKVTNFFQEKFGNPKIEELRTPFFPVATDFSTGKPVVFKTGRFIETIRASISIPFIFQPVAYRKKLLVDGGLSMQVPVEPLKEAGADVIIAVNLSENACNKEDYFANGLVRSPFGIYKLTVNAIGILEINLARENCRDADVVISPDVRNVGWDNFWKPKRVIEAGERAMKNAIPKLKKILET